MRVLEINNVHYKRGGSETVYFNESELLRKNGHEVAHFSVQSEKNLFSEYNEYFISNPDYFSKGVFGKIFSIKRYFYSKEAKEKIGKLIDNFQPDIAHVHLFYGGLTSSILSKLRARNVPVVITLHDYKFLCPVYTFLNSKNEICEKCLSGGYFECIKHRCNRNSLPVSIITALECYFRDIFFKPELYFKRIINVSKFSLEKHFNVRNWNDKLIHIYNFFPNIKEISPNHNKGKYFIFFGRLSRVKGVFSLIKAWSRINNLDIFLKIAGTGPLEKKLKDFVKSNNIKNIRFVGFKIGDELENLIKNSSFAIVPSEWYENNPMSIIESYAYGKPVLGANIGGIPEIVQHNKTGLLFKPNCVGSLKDAIITANRITEDEYSKMSISARNFAMENFSDEIHYKKLIDLYNKVLKSKN